MSSYSLVAKHKETGEIVEVRAMDDYFGQHRYGYKINEDTVILTEMKFNAMYEEIAQDTQYKCNSKFDEYGCVNAECDEHYPVISRESIIAEYEAIEEMNNPDTQDWKKALNSVIPPGEYSNKDLSIIELCYQIEASAYKRGVEEERQRCKEIIEDNGHQQEDNTIWCDMDVLLQALAPNK